MRKRWKKGMALALAAAMCVPAGGTTIFAAGIETGENRQIQEQFDFVTDFNGGVQGPVWYHEYLMTSGSDQGKTIPYEQWVQDWNCWIGLSGVLTSGMEHDMGLIAPAPTADSLATWRAPKDGVVEVSLAHLAYLRRQHQTSGNVGVYIQKNGEMIYPLSGEMLIQAQSKMYLSPITVGVQEGDRISLALRSKKNLTDASAYITPVISYVEKEAKIKENLTQGAAVTVSSASSGYSASGLTDYNISEQQKIYEWKAETADQEWINIAFDNANVSDIVLVDSSEGAYMGDIRCTFSEGESVSLSAAQMEAKDGIRTISLESPVRTSSVKIEFLNNNGAVPVLGDVQILGERLEPEEPDPIETAVYYVDSENGSDGSDGKSEDAAWASLDKVNAQKLSPGTKILFKAGTTYKGALILNGSGTKEAPIIVDMYGEGEKPHIEGEGKVRHTIHLKNVNHVTVRNLEVTNNAAQRQLLTGVFVEAAGCGVMEGVHLDGLDVHDVYGTRQEKTLPNGGIYYEVTDESNDTRFHDISVQNCTVKRVSRTGISVGMTESYELWDGHGGIIPEEIKEKYGHTNVIIRNNYVEESGGDAIVPMFSISPLIEYNISNGASQNTRESWDMYNAAIWPWRCEDAVFQFNEAYNTVENGDGQAYDCDYSRHTIYQYNYSHDNEGGFMLVCQTESLDSVIRYNVSQNDHDSLFLMSNPDNADVYNNTFYVGPDLNKVVDLGGKATLKNNIFYCPEGVKLPNNDWGSGFTYDSNLFYGFETTPNDPNKIIADPLFTDPGKGGSGTQPGAPALDTLSGYMLQKGSPAINAGLEIEDNGGRDLAGNPVGETRPDLGAFETDIKPLMTLAQENIVITDAKEPVRIEAVIKEGSQLEGNIAYTSSDEEIAAADETGKISFYRYGTAIITVSARIDGEDVSLRCKVTLKESELETYSGQFAGVFANTEDVQNPAALMIDGDESTFWHTNWHGDGFELSEENPAVLTLELKEDAASCNGFRFLQRPSNVNGVVEKFKFITGNTFDEAANQITDGMESEAIQIENPANGTWVDVDLPESAGKYIQIRILGAGNGFGAVAEVETYKRTNYVTAENNVALAENWLKRTEKELKEALQKAEDLKKEAADNADRAEELQEALNAANEAASKAEDAKKALENALKEAEEEKDKAKLEAEKAKAEAEKAKAEAEKAKAEADKAKAEADQAKAEADKAKADVEKAQAEAERARAEAQKAQAEADRASEEAKRAQAEADLAKAGYDSILLEKEKAAARAEQLKKELEATKKALEDQQKNSLKEGDSIIYKNVTYQVLDAAKKTAAAVKGKNVSSVTIAKTVKIKGITCTVTEIAEKAFIKSRKLTKVTIGENIQTIGKRAFYGAGKLKNVNIKSQMLKSVKKGAFSKISGKAKISVPKMKKSDYRSMLKGNIPKKAVVK